MRNWNGSKQIGSYHVTQPELLIAYLSYVKEDVRALSLRSAQILEMSILALIEDMRSAEGLQGSNELKLS